MKLKLNLTDFIIMATTIFLLITSIFVSDKIIKKTILGELYVEIQVSGKLTHTLKLSEDKIITLKKDDYSSLLGDMEIEISASRVRVKKEQSPLNYCSKQGWISKAAQPIICLPNEVIVTIRGNIDYDVVLPS